MSTLNTTRSDNFPHQRLRFFQLGTEPKTHEAMYSYRFHEDWKEITTIPASRANGSTWRVLATGSGTAAILADSVSGIVEVAVDGASATEHSMIDWGNQRIFDVENQIIWAQARLRMTVIPTTAFGFGCFGFLVDDTGGPGAVANQICLRSINEITTSTPFWGLNIANGAPLVSQASTIPIVVNQWYTLDLMMFNGLVSAFVDGVQIASNVDHQISGGNQVMQPFIGVQKTTTIRSVIECDSLKVWADRI